MRLGEEIAVLDGLDLAPGVLPGRRDVIDPNGGQYTGGSSYSPFVPMLPSSAGLAAVDMDLVQQMNVLSRRSFDPSDGGNRAGGSDYSPGLPLLPSSSGLSGLDAAGSGTSIRADVIDASEGGNYSGGSSYAEGLPLLPSSAGLAGMQFAEADLLGNAAVLKPRYNVVDPNGGQYTGGSSYSPFVPILPSSSGLAGLAQDAQGKMRSGKPYMAVSSLTLQQLVNTMGGKIKEDGVWARGSNEGLVRAIVLTGLDEEKDVRAALTNIRPAAGGKLLIMPVKYVDGIVQYVAKSNGLSGLDAVPDNTMLKTLKTPPQKAAFTKAASKRVLDQRKQALSQHQVALNKIKRGYSSLTLAQRSEKQASLEKILAMMRNLAQEIDRIRGVRYGMLTNAARAVR